jgi:hypothetical protein
MNIITETPPNREGKTQIAPSAISQLLSNQPVGDLITKKGSEGMKPCVFMPGETVIDDSRHLLVPGLAQLQWQYHYISQPTYTYVGPFYVPSLRLCNHSTWKRGMPCHPDTECKLGDTDLEMADKNRRGLAKADLVMVRISGPISTQTMNDLDFAFAQDKRVVLSITKGASKMDISAIRTRAYRVWKTDDLDRFKCDLDFEVQEARLALLYGDV